MKKHTTGAFLLALLLLATLLGGCKQSGAQSGTANGTPKTLNILMETVPDTDCVVGLLEQFTAETGIEVRVESINYSSMHEKLLTQMLGKTNSYDIIVVDAYWAGEFTAAGWLMDLDPYIEASGFDTSPYIDSMMEMVGVVNGTTYMLPFYNYMLSLVYRTDIFEDAELAAAYEAEFGQAFALPDDMDSYIEMCKFITRETGGELNGAVMQGLRPDPIAMEWLNYLYSCGGDLYDEAGNIIINNANGVHALDLYVDNMTNAAPRGAAGFGFDEAFNVFAQGNAATYVTYNWMVPKLNNAEESAVPGLVDITPMPGGISLNVGWGWGIPANAPDPDAAWEFLQWVESFEVTKARALAGGAPTRSDVLRDPDVLAVYPHFATVESIMETSKIIPVIEDAPQLIEVLGRELSEAVSGSKTSQQALDAVAAEMEGMK